MAKEAYYFSHDFGARNDPKLQKVLMKLGQSGKGVFWDLIEMLFEEGGKLLISECESYAFALRTDCDCILSLINDFDLFEKNDTFFWSDSVNKRISERENKSKKAKESANSRWNNANALKNDANALRHLSERNAIKESKVKEIVNISFIDFYDLYDKKVSKAYSEKKWLSLTNKDRDLIMNHVPKYKKSQPDSKFRKDPITYLNSKTWLDDVTDQKPISKQGIMDYSNVSN